MPPKSEQQDHLGDGEQNVGARRLIPARAIRVWRRDSSLFDRRSRTFDRSLPDTVGLFIRERKDLGNRRQFARRVDDFLESSPPDDVAIEQERSDTPAEESGSNEYGDQRQQCDFHGGLVLDVDDLAHDEDADDPQYHLTSTMIRRMPSGSSASVIICVGLTRSISTVKCRRHGRARMAAVMRPWAERSANFASDPESFAHYEGEPIENLRQVATRLTLCQHRGDENLASSVGIRSANARKASGNGCAVVLTFKQHSEFWPRRLRQLIGGNLDAGREGMSRAYGAGDQPDRLWKLLFEFGDTLCAKVFDDQIRDDATGQAEG